jgi:hypothetical protein
MMLEIPYISLDAIHWQPGWVAIPAEEMKARIIEKLDEAQSGWVIDGDYLRKGGRIAEERATDVICEFPRTTHTLQRELHPA